MQNNSKLPWITPSWPAPHNVKALTTLRAGGKSKAPYDSFNLAQHVQDDPITVQANREYLKKTAHCPSDPLWLSQVHGTRVIDLADYSSPYPIVEADASIALQPNLVCAILTADCLPVLLCNKAGSCVAAIHAGWRGLSAGIIESTVEKLPCDPASLMAWLGPAIGPKVFEVGEDVLLAFNHFPKDAFTPTGRGSWLADIYLLARARLNKIGVTDVFGGDFCTYTESERFYSFRRSKITGRMCTLIWLTTP